MNSTPDPGKRSLSSGRPWIAGLTALAALALAPSAFHAERHLETAARIERGESEYVAQQLASRFRSPFVDRVVLVVQGLPAADSEEGAHVLRKIVDSLDNPDISGILTRLDLADPIFPGRGGGTFVLIGLAPQSSSVESAVPRIRERVRSLQAGFQQRYPAARLELTGEIPLNFDLRKASSEEVQKGESLVLPATLALLLLAFGSLVAALIPLATGQIAIAMTLGIAALLASRFHLSILVQNLAAMLGFGLGIDYALLMVSRFREALAAGLGPREASAISARQAGHTLLVSASTVAIGFAALLTVPISEVRSIGVAGLVVAGASVLLATTVVPAVLAFLGPRIEAGGLRFLKNLSPDSSTSAQKRIDGLFQTRSLEEQRDYFDRTWNTVQWRMIFHLLFNKRVLARRGLSADYFRFDDGSSSFAESFLERSKKALREIPIDTNYFIAQYLLGRYTDPNAVPAWLRKENLPTIRERLDRVEIVTADLKVWLGARPEASIQAFSLSNICELMNLGDTARKFEQVARTAQPGARVCFRNLMIPREVPEALKLKIRLQEDTSRLLLAQDRSFAYARVQAYVVAGS